MNMINYQADYRIEVKQYSRLLRRSNKCWGTSHARAIWTSLQAIWK